MTFLSDLLRYRGQRVITCPETQEGAAVTVKALHAAVSGELALSSCTRWPERAGCAQACLSEIALSPESCLVKSIVTAWYEGKNCVVCNRPFGPIVWHEAPPALLRADGRCCEWKDVAPENLPREFGTAKPLCWYCNNVMELDPKLIVHRAYPPPPRREPLNMTNVY